VCTFEDERSVVVCDVAIERVRRDVDLVFGAEVRYTAVEGEGTRVAAAENIDAEAFATHMRKAIVAAQSPAQR
jgi:hypothetical protein